MATADPPARDGFHSDLRAALQTADTSLVPKTRAARLSTFQSWVAYCASFRHEPSLCDIPDLETRLCHVLVFGLRVRRTGTQQTGGPVRSNTVAKALLAVGAGITMLGGEDPRKQTPGAERNHPLLSSFLKALADEDDPAQRAHPASITIIDNMHTLAGTMPASQLRPLQHTIDLAIVGFFWMLRPAEYLTSEAHGRSQAFRLCDVTFHTSDRLFSATDHSLNDMDINRLVRATLMFTDQKNAVRGEQISHLQTSCPRLCPIKALARICAHLRSHGAPGTIPLHSYYTTFPPGSRPRLEHISPTHITAALRRSATLIHSSTGIDPKLLTARSLRPGGATALLCAGVDSNIIQLLGRWKSDAMIRYLRVAAHAHRTNLAQGMLLAGAYTFSPGYLSEARPVPIQAPAAFLSAVQREALFHGDVDDADSV